jgi:hypothetical protein
MLGSKRYSGFDPRNLGGCALWLDGADTSTFTLSGSNVTQWRDKSGNSNHATAAGTGSPTFQSNIANGLGGVQGASNTYMSNTTMVIPLSNRTVFLVCSTYSTSSPTLGIAQLGTVPTGVAHGVDGLNTTVYQNQPNNQFGWIYRYFSGGGYYRQWSCNGFGSAATTPLRIYGETVRNLVHSPFVDGSNAGDSAITAAPTDCSGYYLGARYDTNAVQFGYPATFAEFIVYSNALPDYQRQQVEGYLAGKWGIRRPNNPTVTLGTFAPTSISGLTTWLDATDASSLTVVGGKISQWQDKSGLSNHFSVVGTSSNGVVQSNYQNNLNVVNFSGTNLYRAPSGSGVYPLDAYIVVALKSVARTDLLGMGPTGTDNFNALELGEYTANRWHNGSSYANRTPNTVSPTNEHSTSFLLMNWSLANSNFVIRRNGVTLSSTTSYTYTPGTGSVLQFGDRQPARTSPDTQLNAYVAEMLVFSNQLGTADRQRVEAYLTNRWNLAPSIPLSLAVTHPYKTVSPLLRPFSPLDLSGLRVWLDAADESQIVYSTGSNVTQLKDKGELASLSNAYNCTATRKSPGALGKSLPTLLSASGTTSQFDGITGNTGTTYVLLAKNNGADIIYLRGESNAAGGEGYTNKFFVNIATNNTFGYFGVNPGNTLVSGSLSNTVHIFIGTWTGSNATLHDNGTLIGTSSNTTLTQPSATINIAINAGNEFGEFMIFNRAITGAERLLLESYLAQKWGLQGLTPSNHAARFALALSPQFNPIQLPSCALWLDAARESGSNGSFVNAITDMGPSNYSITPSSTNAITVVRPGLNGLPHYNFGNIQGVISNFTGTVKYTHVLLVQATAGNFFYFHNNSGNNYANYTYYGNFDLTFTRGAQCFDASYGRGTPISVNSWDIVIARYGAEGTNPPWRLNGTQRNTTSGVGSAWPTSNDTVTGTLRIGGSGGLADSVRVAEVLHFNDGLTTTQCQQVEGYLAWKWGLQSKLPSTHPYKNQLLL